MIVLDNFSLFFKVFALAAAILAVWMSLGSNEIDQVHQGEYYTLLLTCTLGMFFMASSSNLLMAYLSLELVSLTSYVLDRLLAAQPTLQRGGAEVSYLRRRRVRHDDLRHELDLRHDRQPRLRRDSGRAWRKSE